MRGIFVFGKLFGSLPFTAGQVLGQPPVHDLHLAERADHDVERLEVAVDDALGVGEADGLGDLLEDLHEPRQTQRAATAVASATRPASDRG